MKLTSTLAGLERTLHNIEQIKKTSHQAQVTAITRVALLLRDTIVNDYVGAGHPEHPDVQTGRLKASIRYVVQDGTPVTAVVGSDADYAAHVEFGHAQEPGRFVAKLGKRLKAGSVRPYPFMRPGMDAVVESGKAARVFGQAITEEVLKS